MKLIASLICRNELGRYLEPCVGHLLEFCDELRVLDDVSSDGTFEWLRGIADPRVVLLSDKLLIRNGDEAFLNHARARQGLLDFTLEGDPTHILAIDADEFVSDGAALRAACADDRYDAWSLCLQEVWNARDDRLEVRQDGGWVEHDVAMLWRPDRTPGLRRIVDRGPATGRTPDGVGGPRTGHTCTSLLHFGWANEAERRSRYDRYVRADGGRFHAQRHLESIMYGDERVQVLPMDWPAGLDAYKAQILDRANGASNIHGNISA